ncbi:MAG: 2-aminoethylphosphonate--pyruvate transaminase [Hyphomicrobiales bacterium]|nr:2-aminoethylphosphonate--pyruvate transaminase [Hyphomicrobiales bacterium]MCP5374061.1 2-aminoethylphosphonate--pyruvate transaminase [Hyphomicrobiales bacterium]
MPRDNDDPLLLTPGPLTTSAATKAAMLHDWGSRDDNFIAINARVRRRLLDIAQAADSHVCVPLQGSGTFVVEAALGTLVPRAGKALILINGAYGKRMAKILDYMGRAYAVHETAENSPPDPADVDALLAGDPAITHVLAVHCETTSGILNPIEAIAAVVAARGRRLIIDAMSAFGAIALDARAVPFDAVMASSNKCLEGVPGMGFALIRKAALEEAAGNAHSLSLDLYDQWVAMEKNAQWRFTPPTHVIVAFDKALDQFEAAGGVAGRHDRYAGNCRILVEGMAALGFRTLLPPDLQAPIIVTFHMPADPAFQFQRFYDSLKDRGFVIYPGKLTVADSFRIGCIGDLHADDMKAALAAIETTLREMGVASGAPPQA